MTNLNPDQQAVVNEHNGARCVLAGPGSGKTSTMVKYFERLCALGIPTSAIRCVTFSKEAATTIEKRAGVKDVFSTFHSLGYEICSDLADFKPVEPELRHRLMIRLVKRWGCDYKELDRFISRMRHAYISPQEAYNDGGYPYALCSSYFEYEQARQQEGWMDFDSMLCDAVKLLEDPQKRARWQFQYLIVDEAQDTDDLQWHLMKQLSEKYGNITVVGDPNQSIYTWRGASPENLTHFERWFPNGKYYYLGRNYRSTQRIVKFVRENAPAGCPPELLQRMTPARVDIGDPISFKMYWNEDDEAESALKLAQADPLNSIILARTNRGLGPVERLCSEHNIRYHLLGKSGFWKQQEIRKALDKLKDFASLPVQRALDYAFPQVESKYSVDDRTDRDNDALENLKTLRIIAAKFQNVREFLVYGNKMIHRRNDPKGVSLSTVHQAKGGEWKNVFIIGAKNQMMPHKNGDAKEEQRIYFVAISRAIDRLRISWAGSPSPFLDRYLTEEILDKLRVKASEVEKLQEQVRLFA